jgi:predicted membrane protein
MCEVGGAYPKRSHWRGVFSEQPLLARGFLRTTVTGEGFTQNNRHWRGVYSEQPSLARGLIRAANNLLARCPLITAHEKGLNTPKIL